MTRVAIIRIEFRQFNFVIISLRWNCFWQMTKTDNTNGKYIVAFSLEVYERIKEASLFALTQTTVLK